jgi:hypothetical protein
LTVNRLGCVLVLAGTALATSARPALAQHTLNLSLGYFMMRGDGRLETDILLIEHADVMFDVRDFNGATVGGEWLVPIGDFFEAGAGVSFSRRTVPTVHVRVVDSDGSKIERDLGFRQLPLAFTVRMLPLGQSYSVQPYFGGGVAMINWRFSESGDFVAPNRNILRGEEYVAIGKTVGPMVLLGLRVAGDTIACGFEGRYQSARGSFGPVFARVLNPDIDLDGWTLQFTTGMRFGG